MSPRRTRPITWAARCRRLLPALFEAADDGDRALIAALDQALTHWLQATEAAGFDAELPLPVLREAWLGALDAPGGGQRFRAGGVTFCTLLPLRAIPFEVVCLLGMNDGDYPRRAPRNDFDLMALPGQARPGDRSRRDDDRQLMLDALLSARRVLYVSWTGRSVRDNQALPPSVLVAQLRDHLAAVWGNEVVEERTTEHPLQPFSRRYFEGDAALFTHAREWRAAHSAEPPAQPPAPPLQPRGRHGLALPPAPGNSNRPCNARMPLGGEAFLQSKPCLRSERPTQIVRRLRFQPSDALFGGAGDHERNRFLSARRIAAHHTQRIDQDFVLEPLQHDAIDIAALRARRPRTGRRRPRHGKIFIRTRVGLRQVDDAACPVLMVRWHDEAVQPRTTKIDRMIAAACACITGAISTRFPASIRRIAGQ